MLGNSPFIEVPLLYIELHPKSWIQNFRSAVHILYDRGFLVPECISTSLF